MKETGPVNSAARWIAFRNERAAKGEKPWTYLAVCPNSSAVASAALAAAQEAQAPLMLTATLNQVDIEEAYTGWTQEGFQRWLGSEVKKRNFNEPLIVELDHGGPWCKDYHRGWPLEKTMGAVERSMEACVRAGYSLIHVDCSIDPEGLSPEKVVSRTVELIAHCESVRASANLPGIGYEVGTEEIGGTASFEFVDTFLRLLKSSLERAGLSGCWPVFVVAPIGTELHTSRVDVAAAKRMCDLVRSYGCVIKVHFSDNVANMEVFPDLLIGGVNIGPEFTEIEFETLAELEEKERKLVSPGRRSAVSVAIESAVVESGRWRKWLLKGEGADFSSLAPERRKWLAGTGARYVWTRPNVLQARALLAQNLGKAGIDSEAEVVRRIANRIIRHFKTFNLCGLGPVLSSDGSSTA